MMLLTSDKKSFLKIYTMYVVIISILSFALFDFYTKNKLDDYINEVSHHEVGMLSSYTGQFLRYVESASEHVKSLYREKHNKKAFISGKNQKEEIARSLETMISRNDIYFQARWVAQNGQELVRVKQNNKGQIFTFTTNLQNKSDRYYVKAGLNLKEGEVYTSKIDLNVENGKIEIPHIRTLRVVSKIPKYGNKDHGIFVVNLNIDKIITEIKDTYTNSDINSIYIFNMNSDIVVGKKNIYLSNKGKCPTCDNEFRHVFSEQHGTYRSKNGIFTWNYIHPEYMEAVDEHSDNWRFVSFVSADKIQKEYAKIIYNNFIYGFILYLLLLIVGGYAAYIQVKRLEGVKLLAEKKLEAEHASQAKGDFVANMSHEIRTPMNAIIGLLDILRDSKLTKNQLDLTRKVQNAAHALLAILNDILEFSKIEAGRLTLVNDSMSLDDIYSKVSDLFSVAASMKGVEIIYCYGRGVPAYVVGDAQRLTQVITNLVGNAVKFTNHGTITITTSVVEKNKDSVRLAFSVRDTGIGMSGEQIRRIFTPFMQADNSTSRKYGGSGLGLAISQNLVRLMDGEISVVSRPAAGSEFFFSAVFGIAENAYYTTSGSMVGKRILIVDAIPDIRNTLKLLLTEWHFEATATNTADKAIAMLRTNTKNNIPYDFILLDAKTLGQKADDFIRQLHTCEETGEISAMRIILVIQAHQSMDYAADLDVWTVMKKPLLESNLFNTLSSAASQQAAPDLYAKKEQKTLRERAAGIRGARILLVEDNALNQEVATSLLKKMQLHVEIANNGQEAVDMVRDQSFDAILMDLQMPVMDGFEAARHIRATEHGKAIPIIAMTAAVFDDDRKNAIATGMNDHIGKPIDIDDLLKSLLRWCPPAAPDPPDMSGPENAGPKDAAAPVPEENAGTQSMSELPENLPGFDISAARQRLMNDEALLLSLIRRFISEYEEWETTLETVISSGDMATAQRLVHTLKGAAGTIGAVHLQGLAAKTEEDIKNGNVSDTAPLITRLQDTLKILTEVLPQEAEVRPRGPFLADQALPLLQKISEALDRHAVIKDEVIADLRTAMGEKAADASVVGLLTCIDKFDYAGAKKALETVRENARLWAVNSD